MGRVRTSRSSVDVREVKTAAGRRAFLHLPWKIYRDDLHWVPPLLRERREFIDPKRHPFYRHGSAKLFVAYRNAAAVGRILVSDDPRYNQIRGENVGCFGMFECLEDQGAAAALLDSAAGWLRARGRAQIMGPIDYSMNYPCGLLIDGFDTPPRVLMNHNPTYYAGLLQAWGLKKAKDLYAWWGTWDTIEVAHELTSMGGRSQSQQEVVVRSMNPDRLERDAQILRLLYNQTLEPQWGMVPLTDVEIEYLAHSLKRFGLPQLVLIAEVGDKPVGFSLTLPDINEVLRRIQGRVFPFGFLKWLFHKRRIRTVRGVATGVLESYRRHGVYQLLSQRSCEIGRSLGFEACELSWTLEDHAIVNDVYEMAGLRRYKTYRIYQRGV